MNADAMIFDSNQVHAALQRAAQLADTNALPDDGLAALSAPPSDQPLAYADELGQVWPHPVGSPVYPHLNYFYTREQVQAAMQASRGILVVQTVPPTVVPQVTGQAPAPVDTRPASVQAKELAQTRTAMLAAFSSPVSSK